MFFISYDKRERLFERKNRRIWLHFSMLLFYKGYGYRSWSRLINLQDQIGTAEKVPIIEKSG